ncbi:Uncharacterised protein [BD1-7 clade bacterium]|uniref:Outer membrane protein beta-barrel domain-containing protein n=1 Tax=BD1-7 clade bacterium TaxID=2029982 RepID=A0A5S9QTY9_9GAMM|nr:Uncharacterised protein [BD1-7 clade bacterium]CAA0122820.1 Uncharacterised protein [BD1-7 clade bacterium]
MYRLIYSLTALFAIANKNNTMTACIRRNLSLIISCTALLANSAIAAIDNDGQQNTINNNEAAALEPSNEEITDNTDAQIQSSAVVGESQRTAVTYESRNDDDKQRCAPRWSDFLPILGKAACEAGYVLPRPFGISAITLFQNQPFEVNSIDVEGSILGGDVPDINPFVKAANVSVAEATITLRLDAWIFPFLNVYALGGHTNGTAKGIINVNAVFDDPAFFPIPACFNALPSLNDKCYLNANNLPFSLDFKSTNYGGGITIAGGIGDFFAMIDGNYTISDINISTDDAKTTVISSRIGWNGSIGIFSGSLWVGGMYQDINQILNIPVGVSIPNQGPVGPAELLEIDSIRIDQSASAPYSYLIGGRWAFTESIELLTETNFGFQDRKQFLAQLSYRF